MNRPGDALTPGPTVGLVLSSGVSGAGFQLGALRYLYDTLQITASVITGTSTGSVLGALLAQGDDHAGQRRILGDIERVGRDLRESSDIFTELGWYTELKKVLTAWRKARGARAFQQESSAPTPPGLGWRRRSKEEPEQAGNDSTIRLPRRDAFPVLDTLGLIWTLGRSGTHLDTLLRGARDERSMFRPGPIFDVLLDPPRFDPERLARSRTELRIAVVGLESGELRYVTGTGALVDRENRPLWTAGPLSVTDAIRASCAIPGVFPPVRLGSEHYVDGGTRENAPVELAMAHLGADPCYAIISVFKGVSPESSYADKGMLSILLRSTAGVMAELQLNDVARARAAGAIVIAPEISLAGSFDVDPGLLAISMDYGYLRAAEVCEGATEQEHRLSRDVVQTRHLIWVVENALFGPDSGESPAEDQPDLAALKQRLRDLVAEIPASRLPEGASAWWRTWEGHRYEINAPTDWAETGDRAGSTQ